MRRHVPGDWALVDEQWAAGRIGSRRIFERQADLLPADSDALFATAAAEPLDPTFTPFARRAIELRVRLEVVSDGFGFFVAPALARLGVPDVPVVTAAMTFDDRARIAFPNGHRACGVCGTCKRQRVLAHQAAGRTVAFVGDGISDRYAAAHADVVFAKRHLVAVCEENGWPWRRWDDFDELRAWMERTVGAWRGDPASLGPPASRPFICGPEAWGPGRLDPPAADGVVLPALPGVPLLGGPGVGRPL